MRKQAVSNCASHRPDRDSKPDNGGKTMRRIANPITTKYDLPLITILLILITLSTAIPSATAQCSQADPDGSGTIDIYDYATFASCQTGPNGGPIEPACATLDLDTDGDIDLQDFARFQNAFGVTHGRMLTSPTFIAGVTQSSMDIGDLDGDGDLDIALGSSGRVTVMMNNSSGNVTLYSDRVSYFTGVGTSSVVMGDLNGDGYLDLATANPGTIPDYIGTVSVFMNFGDGTFAENVIYSGGVASRSIAIGDIDNDGDLDLAVANSNLYPEYLSTVSVLMNQGDGTFADEVSYNSGPDSSSIVLGDLDSDGDLDIAVANSGYAPDRFGSVSVLMNDGNGTFADDVLYDTGEYSRSVAIGDFDRDGDLDLAVGNRYDDDISVLLNLGDGTFADEVRYIVGEGPTTVLTADVDGDENLDLVVTVLHSDDISVLMNYGDGLFANAVSYETRNSPRSAAVGDVDGDGDIDFVVGIDFGILVLPNHGDGVFDGAFVSDVTYETGDSPQSVAIGDMNGDGNADLAVANIVSNDVSILLNYGDGTLADDVTYGVGDNPLSVAVGDLDGDGDLDIAVANGIGDNVSVLLNRGDATFADDETYATGKPSSVVIGDLDGDGDLDLVVANGGANIWGEDGDVSVLLNHGDGTFADNVRYGTGSRPLTVAIGDLDSDGDIDLAVTNENGFNVSVLLNNGDGTFADDVLYETSFFPGSVAIGDLDVDGDLDLAVSSAWGGGITVLLNIGDGTFADLVYAGGGGSPDTVVIGDMDGDADPDLIMTNLGSEIVSVLLNNGDGTFATDLRYSVGELLSSVAIGDLDGDGDLDLVLTNESNDNVSLVLSGCIP